jgi:MFS transporter, FSR family, fosmidomycin resistance protein
VRIESQQRPLPFDDIPIKGNALNPLSKTKQWVQLMALTILHGIIDMPGGIFVVALPDIQTEFGFSYAKGCVLLGIFNLVCNWVQVLTGGWRANKERPIFQYIGIILCATLLAFGLVPRDSGAIYWLLVLSIISGWGVALPHPEALRAIHHIDKISPSMTTGVFMVGGVVGFVIGSWLSPKLISAYGLAGLYTFLPVYVVGILMLLPMGIRLSIEPTQTGSSADSGISSAGISFWPILCMTTLAGTSTAVLMWITPQKLRLLGIDSPMVPLFMTGGGIGSLVLGWVAGKIGELSIAAVGLLSATVLLIAYTLSVSHEGAIYLAIGVGFVGFGTYPLMITAVKSIAGPGLGQRMGLMVGGVWGVANIIVMALGPVAKQYGLDGIFYCTPIGYCLAAILGLILLFRVKTRIKVPVDPDSIAITEPVA